jgi:hypothetical protein
VTRWRASGLAVITAIAVMACATTTRSAAPATSSPLEPSPSAIATASVAASPSPSLAVVSGPCAPDVQLKVLPEWARAGFSDPEPTALQALGRSGEIIAILFGGTLYSPPSDEVSNKILWVAKDGTTGPEGLVISAQRMDGAEPLGEPVERVVEGGPGPSTIDLPEPGCWRLSLTWADRTDSLDLEYVDPAAAP